MEEAQAPCRRMAENRICEGAESAAWREQEHSRAQSEAGAAEEVDVRSRSWCQSSQCPSSGCQDDEKITYT